MSIALAHLQGIEWHDIPVAGLHVNFKHRQLTLHLDFYDEALAAYVQRELSFAAIDSLEMVLPALPASSQGDDLELNALTITPAGELFAVSITLLTDHGPSASISFRCRQAALYHPSLP